METKSNNPFSPPNMPPTMPANMPPNMNDPKVVLSLLEADQVVAAKQQSRFGHRNLSLGLRALLWGLRVYVVIMLVIVLISVVRATHALP